MSEIIELSKIVPFTDIFYRTCRFNPLISAVNYYGGSIRGFLANDIFTLEYNERNDGFKLMNGVIECQSRKELLAGMGIDVNHDFLTDDIIYDIKESIRENTPVYLTIDRFHWSAPCNHDFINQSHWTHYLLVTGFNDVKSEFTIIDSDVERCSKEHISYGEMDKCYESGKVWKNEHFYVEAFQIYEASKKDGLNRDYPLVFIDNMFKQRENIYDGLKNIKKAQDYYSCLKKDETILEQRTEDVARSFLYMDQARRAELYRIKQFFNSDTELSSIIIRIINTIGIMRSTYLKTLKTAKNPKGCIDTLINLLDKQYILENKFYNTFYAKQKTNL